MFIYDLILIFNYFIRTFANAILYRGCKFSQNATQIGNKNIIFWFSIDSQLLSEFSTFRMGLRTEGTTL